MTEIKATARNFKVSHASDWCPGCGDFGILNALHQALDRHELRVHYQPEIDLRTGSIVGVEALLRWEHPQRGLLGPDEFIRVTEETGLIVPITDFVIEAVASQLDVWRQAGLPCPRIAINCSVQLFRDGQFAERLFGILDRHDLPHRCIELEITETQLMADPKHMISALGSLKARGLTVAVDDFGTGYSSLAYLKRFPIDTLKIDQSFVRDLTTSPDDAALTTSIILMGKSLGLNVVAEGVETRSQMTFLQVLECDEAQGYLFGKPMDATAMKVMLETGIDPALFPPAA